MGIKRKVKTLMWRYGEDAFLNHRESVYSSISAICYCLEFLQNQEDWSIRRALPLRKGWCADSYWKEKKFWEKYDRKLREEELGKLYDMLDTPGQWPGEEIPLKNFLKQGLKLMIEEGTVERWSELMETQVMADRYTDFRAFQEAVYVMGFLELWKYQKGINFHYLAGDFRDAEYLMLILRKQIPETEWENYDLYCTALLNEMERKRKDAVEQVLKEREEWLEASQKAAGGIPVIDFFNRKMMETEEEKFRQFVTEQLAMEDDWTEDMEWERDLYLHLMKMCRLYSLADSFIYGGSRIKERLFAYLSEEEQLTVMERWVEAYYPSDVQDLMNKLLNMTDAADRLDKSENEEEEDATEQTIRIFQSLAECGSADEEYMASHRDNIVNSLEKLAGRAITADDVDLYYGGWFKTNMQDC